MEPKPQAVASIRVSTDHQDATAQEHRIRAWCETNGYDLVALFGNALSGESAGLPVEQRETEKAIREAIRRRCVCVVDSMDRLSRVVPHLYALSDRVLKAGANIISLSEGMNWREAMATSSGEAMFGMRAVFAQFERRQTQERVRKAMADIRQLGYKTGTVPYGWREDYSQPQTFSRKDGSTKIRYKLVPVPAEQTIVAKIKQWRSKGMSYRKIASSLNKQAIPTKRGSRWFPMTVQKISKRIA